MKDMYIRIIMVLVCECESYRVVPTAVYVFRMYWLLSL